MGFPRQEHWRGLPLLSPFPTLLIFICWNPTQGPVRDAAAPTKPFTNENVFILQFPIELSLYLFPITWHAELGLYGHKFCVCMSMCSVVQSLDSETPWTTARQTLSMEFSRQEYWSRLPFPTPRDLSNQAMNLYPQRFLHWQADSLPLCHLWSTLEILPD